MRKDIVITYYFDEVAQSDRIESVTINGVKCSKQKLLSFILRLQDKKEKEEIIMGGTAGGGMSITSSLSRFNKDV